MEQDGSGWVGAGLLLVDMLADRRFKRCRVSEERLCDVAVVLEFQSKSSGSRRGSTRLVCTKVYFLACVESAYISWLTDLAQGCTGLCLGRPALLGRAVGFLRHCQVLVGQGSRLRGFVSHGWIRSAKIESLRPNNLFRPLRP